MIGSDVVLQMVVNTLKNVLHFIGCGLKCKICIVVFIVTLIGLCYVFKETNEKKMYKNSSYTLKNVIKNKFVLLYSSDNNEENAVFDRDVDKMLMQLYKKYNNFSLIQITVNQYPATVWRLSEIQDHNINIFHNKSEKRRAMLMERMKYVKWMIQHNDRAKYHSVYSISDLSSVPNMNILYDNIKKYQKISTHHSKYSNGLIVYTLIKFDNDDNYYIFIENGGTQLHRDHDMQNIQQQKYLCFISLTKNEYNDSIYKYIVEDILYDKL